LLAVRILFISLKLISQYQTRIITHHIAATGIYLVIGAIKRTISERKKAAKIAARGVFAQAE
jgi:hypothetical protein